MDFDSIPWDICLVFFAAGCITGGIVLSIILSPSRRRNEETVAELDKTEHEFTAYREDVDRHFTKTAELVNAMTESYRAVYQHLSEGAQNLCDEESLKPAIQFSEPKLVEQSKKPIAGGAESPSETETETSEAAEPIAQAEAETAVSGEDKTTEASIDTESSSEPTGVGPPPPPNRLRQTRKSLKKR